MLEKNGREAKIFDKSAILGQYFREGTSPYAFVRSQACAANWCSPINAIKGVIYLAPERHNAKIIIFQKTTPIKHSKSIRIHLAYFRQVTFSSRASLDFDNSTSLYSARAKVDAYAHRIQSWFSKQYKDTVKQRQVAMHKQISTRTCFVLPHIRSLYIERTVHVRVCRINRWNSWQYKFHQQFRPRAET